MSGFDGGGFYGGGNDGGGGGFNAGGGGGFGTPQDNTAAAGGGFATTPQSSQKASGGGKNRDKQTLLPVTIKQLIEATQDHPDDAFHIGGAEVAHVRIIGCIVESREQSTNLTYTVEDGTGRMEVKMWIDTDDGDHFAEQRAKWKEGAYVRVIGNLRSFQEKRNIVAFDIRPVTDFNEVTHHMLEAIFVNLKSKQAPAQPAAPQAMKTDTSATSGFGAAAGVGGGGGDGMDAVAHAVLQVFKGSDDDSGVDIRVAIQQLVPNGFSAQQIRTKIHWLSDEGHLYSTIDENHFKTTA